MNLSEVWEDDMASFIAFLIVILPLPFVYVIIENNGAYRSHVMIALNTFLAVAVFWFAVAVIYYVMYIKGSSEEDTEAERMSSI